mmetsp:Transcript_3591/g.10183  ORF Transcript_3591/g.10183 Transcript_3591/m.10183 type:complete len:209 (-) Transcript_3591:933-1559(-)
MRRSSFRPTRAVGEKARDTKGTRGCQNQKLVKTAMPTSAGSLAWPRCDMSCTVTLRPPASRSPDARIAPKRVMASSCLSPTTFSRCLRKWPARLSVPWGEACMSTSACAMSAPWRTYSTESEAILLSISTASRRPVPAHATPTAIVAPYRTWGLYDSARSATTLGHCAGALQRMKPSAVTAARLTLSLTSETAMSRTRRTAELLLVPA